MRKLLSVSAVGLGVVLIGGAALVRFTVAPSQAVLPSDTDSTRTYTGTATTLFNPAALTTPGVPVLLKNIPITATHTTKVLASKGSNALVSDAGQVLVQGSSVAGFDYRYAVNRTSMDRGRGYPAVVRQSGVTFNWPIRTQPHDYPAWVPDTQSTTPLKCAGRAKRGGLSTYVYTAALPAAPITDPATLAQLPASLPKATLTAMAAGLGLSSGDLARLQQALPSLPDPVPFSYTYAMTATFWVEPATGEVVDLQEHETRTLGLKTGSLRVPVTPVMDITYASSPAQLVISARDARHDASLVNMVYTTLPRGLAIGGGALVLAGLVSWGASRRRAESGSASPRTDSESELQPV